MRVREGVTYNFPHPGNLSDRAAHDYHVGDWGRFCAGFLLVGLVGCDPASGRDPAPYAPGVGKADEPSAIESFDYSAVAQDLSQQADDPVPPGAPGAPEEDPIPEDVPPDDAPPPESCDGFECDDGTCLDASAECDGVAECSGSEDEANCDEPCSGFQCGDGSCIDATWECDGFDDCTGGEDESNCGTACDGFECGDGTCIDGTWLCDEIVDCADGSDEDACGIDAAPSLDVQADRAPALLDTECVFALTASSAVGGAIAGEVVSKSCTAGGVVVGVASSPSGVGAVGGFGVAAVCATADAVQLDALAGAVAGGVAGALGGIAFCDGGIVDTATDYLGWLWGADQSAVPVYNIEASGVSSGLGDAALTCTGPYVETAYHHPDACGDDVFSLTCERGPATNERCLEWKETANRNLICHWARIVAANTAHGGNPNAGHMQAIRAAHDNYADCYWLLDDNCFEDEHEPMDEDDAKSAAMGLICR